MSEPETMFLHWDKLNKDQMQERIDWLRSNLVAGLDWGFCSESRTCVLMDIAAIMLYKLRWFETNQQEEVPSPIYGTLGEPF